MSQLTAYTLLEYDCNYSQLYNTQPVLHGITIYRGSAVGFSGGYARQLVAADIFAGFAEETVIGDAATDGAQTVGVRSAGAVGLAVTSAAATDIGRDVYASDGATFTFTATGNTLIGKVIRWEATGKVLVAFNAQTGVN